MFKFFRKQLKNQKGFTLVELMVVVVIIGILIAIAVPAYSKIKDSSEAKACQANMRTIFGAMEVYRAENDGDLPDDMSDLEGYFEGGIPSCPSGGDPYIISGGVVKCENHGSDGGDGGNGTTPGGGE